jgi:hypothetical protein
MKMKRAKKSYEEKIIVRYCYGFVRKRAGKREKASILQLQPPKISNEVLFLRERIRDGGRNRIGRARIYRILVHSLSILPSSFFAVEDRQTRSSLVSATKCLSFTFNEKVQNSSVRRQSSSMGGTEDRRDLR